MKTEKELLYQLVSLEKIEEYKKFLKKNVSNAFALD